MYYAYSINTYDISWYRIDSYIHAMLFVNFVDVFNNDLKDRTKSTDIPCQNEILDINYSSEIDWIPLNTE